MVVLKVKVKVCFARCMFFGIHIALSLHPQCRCRFYVSTTVSFLRMMHHCIMAPGFQPKERPANRGSGQSHRDWQRNWFASYAILAV